jgi:hypothetical protein
VTVTGSTRPVARCQEWLVGTHRPYPQGGSATFLGFRPRDNQSCSLGYDTRTWFDVLLSLGAYPPTGKFSAINDNTEYLSRTGEYLACRFPNGAITIARHLRLLEEDWEGGFARNPAADAAYLARHPLPPDKLELRDFKVDGHTVTYDGSGAVAFRLNRQASLVAFAGSDCRQITVDGRTAVFAESPLSLVTFAPIASARRMRGGAIYEITIGGTGTIRIPASGLPEKVKLFTEDAIPGSKGTPVPFQRDGEAMVIRLTPAESGRRIWVAPAE